MRKTPAPMLMPCHVAVPSIVSTSLGQPQRLQKEGRYVLEVYCRAIRLSLGSTICYGRRRERIRGFTRCSSRCSKTDIKETCKEIEQNQYHKSCNQITIMLISLLCGRVVAIIFTIIQVVAPIQTDGFLGGIGDGFISPASAILYSPDTKVPRSADVALRRAIPTVNLTMKKIQESLEDILYLLRIPQRKPYGSMEGDVKKAIKLIIDEKASILGALPADQREQGEKVLASLIDGPGGLVALLDSIAAKDPDKVSFKIASTLNSVAQLEVLQAPGLPFLLPADYQQFPRLTGRATVEILVEKGDGSTFTLAAGGGPQRFGKIEVVLDGYSAPLTAGNFANLVLKGAYNGIKLRSTEQAILSDNELNSIGTSLPIEILPAGEFQPLYRTTLNVQDGELPVLPLSVYGAVAMAHNPSSEDFSSSSQFFIYLYDRRNAGLGGLSFDEGQFSVFGYAVNGKELLSQLTTGDIMRSARLVSGADRLVFPSNTG